MESAINAGGNFYTRRPLHPASPTSEQEHQEPQRPYEHHSQPFPDFDSPQLPPKLPFLTTSNLQAVATNGYGVGVTHDGRDPDDFYRDYRGAQLILDGYTDTTARSMAATASESRPTPSSLRSNGNGTTPKHPPLPTTRNHLKPSYRSASAPLDNRLGNAKSTPALNGLAKSQQPSVKDLLKRFDQNNEAPSSAARKPVPRLITNTSEPPGYMRDRGTYHTRTAGSSSSAGSSRPGAPTRDTGPSRVKSPANARSTQRTRFAAEDQHSNNTLSSAARANRPRNGGSGSVQASKSMTNLSPTSPRAPALTPVRRPLFGEVLDNSQAGPGAGYGINHVSARRTSESNLHPSTAHQRSSSEVDISPSSPTAWYLGVTPTLDDVDPSKARRLSPGHNRNHSDLADHRVNTMNGVKSSFQTPTSPGTSGNPPSSRLPIATKRLSGSSSSSQPSTRASSPFKNRSAINGKRHTPNQRPWSPAGRATTPTPRSARGRAKTPEKTPSSNASLKAYISSPPPKTSPPLRSSRPRQPVSSATSVQAIQSVRQSSRSSQQAGSGMKLTRNTGSQDVKSPRHVKDSGPVDFAARRERIQRAYTKSIHESEQREIRAANLRRLTERQARSASEKAQQEQDAANELSTFDALHLENIQTSSEPLRVTTSFFKPRISQDAQLLGEVNQDSPTLGLPGSFVDQDEPPASAVSNVTGITEFDNEPQTDAPHLNRSSSFNRSRQDIFSSNIVDVNDFSLEQARFRIEQLHTPDGNGSIHIMLGPTTMEDPRAEPTPTNSKHARDELRGYTPPGAYLLTPDLNTVNFPVFASTLTTASPKQTSPEPSRSVTPLEHLEQAAPGGRSSTSPNAYSSSRIQSISGSQTSDSVEAAPIRLPQMRSALSPLYMGRRDEDYLHTPVTEMDYDESDGTGQMSASEQGNYDSCDQDRELKMSPQDHRGSRLSAWTDYSVNSAEESSDRDCNLPGSAIILTPHAGRRPSPPPKDLSPEVPPKPENYSPHPSPLTTKFGLSLASPSADSTRPSGATDGFCLSKSNATPRFSNISIPLWPDHSPPPPPVSHSAGDTSPVHSTRTPPRLSFYNRRPQSNVSQPSLNGIMRNPESRRDSDDVYSPPGSDSRSSTHVSTEDVTTTKPVEEPKFATDEEKQAAEKKKKRLFQRRMLIKELVDTEAVYLKDMNVVEEIYKGTAEACPKLDSNDIKTIFRNSDQIVAFSTMFFDELKSAASSIYSPRSQRSRQSRATTTTSSTTASLTPSADDRLSIALTLTEESDEQKDMKTFVGANFGKHLKQMQTVYTDFLKNGELASSRLAALQNDSAVKVWLSECNLVAKDLTAAWDLDALLVKPVQRITRYQLLLRQIFECTEKDHPDYTALEVSVRELFLLLSHIDDMKKRIHMVGKIVGRKRKESDTRFGIARAFGRRAEKVQHANPNRPDEDEVYLKLHEKFGDDYLRLQVVLRDVEFYTRQVTTYVSDFLRYLSSIELFMRTSASPYPELESKWVRFNLSMRDLGTVALEEHVAAVRKRVIEPFEQVIQAYGPPGLAMKKRNKRRLDYEKSIQGKKLDEKLKELVDQYEALNETLKLELPKLSQLTEKVGNICLIQLIGLQTQWYKIWQDKVKVVLEDSQFPREVEDIVDMFHADYRFVQARALELGIVNGTIFGPAGASTTRKSLSSGKEEVKVTSRPANLEPRPRGLSLNSDRSPSLPTPDFAKRYSGQFSFSPIVANGPGLPQFASSSQPYVTGHARASPGSPAISESSARQQPTTYARPNTGKSQASEIGIARTSNDFNTGNRRESGSTYSASGRHVDGPLQSRPFSGLFHSAMPMPEGPDESQRSSRASSRDRNVSGGYNVLYLAASLFEFNISATKSEAGYPYLTYQAGEIFDVIGEKGELWLAKNQDDATDKVGWIWSKHFARLATD